MSNPLQRLKESLLAAPIIWKGDYPYFIHPLTDGVPRLEPSVLTAVVQLIENAVNWDSIDLVLGIEAMGLPLTSPLSMRNNRPQVVVRKRSYGLEGELAIDQSTGYSKGEMFLNDIKQGERLLIVDDVSRRRLFGARARRFHRRRSRQVDIHQELNASVVMLPA